jgi:hypothetical protein
LTLVDTNVLFDVLTSASVWYAWSAERLSQRAAAGPLLLNEVVYAEFSVRMPSEAELLDALTALEIELSRMPTQAPVPRR